MSVKGEPRNDEVDRPRNKEKKMGRKERSAVTR